MKDGKILTLPHLIAYYYFSCATNCDCVKWKMTLFWIIFSLSVSFFPPNHVLWNVWVFSNVLILICQFHISYHRIFWCQSNSCEFRTLINHYFKMPSNKVTKRIKNVWTEEDMQSTLALVNSTTQSIRSIAKEVRFILKKYKRYSMYINLNLLSNLTFSFFPFSLVWQKLH